MPIKINKESSKPNDQIVEIFTDGSCKGNPGKGGWAALLRWGSTVKTISGHDESTTNNRMELTAAIEAIKIVKTRPTIKLYTDSQYLRLGITQWLALWKQNNWKTSDRSPVKNRDLWEQLDQLNSKHNIIWFWVKAHNGTKENEIVDQLAKKACQQDLITEKLG